MKFRLIDAIAPFIQRPNGVVNYSKVNFTDLEEKGLLSEEGIAIIEKDFIRFIDNIQKEGYSDVIIDDLAHMISFEWYPSHLKVKLSIYKKLYDNIISYALKKKIGVFVSTDLLFSHSAISRKYPHFEEKVRFLQLCVRTCLKQYPIKGITFRFGESDGVDITGDFVSQRIIRKPQQLAYVLKKVLPDFQNTQKLLIVRTWSFGSYKIGDVLWNKKTFYKCFGKRTHDNLIISIKHGPADFFRNMPLNPTITDTIHPKIVEMQARREHEGAGRFPSYNGAELERLKKRFNQSVIGFISWVQMGGWVKTHRRTYLDESGFWNELNSSAIMDIWHRGYSSKESIERFSTKKNIRNKQKFIQLVESCEKIIDKAFYFHELEKDVYIKRLRIPPNIPLFWDTIVLNSVTKYLIRNLVKNQSFILSQKSEIQQLSNTIREVNKQVKVFPVDILYLLRTVDQLIEMRNFVFTQNYDTSVFVKKKFVDEYSLILEEKPRLLLRLSMVFIVKLLVRKKSQFRLIDRIIVNTLVLPIICRYFLSPKRIPNEMKNFGTDLRDFFL